MKNKRIAGKKNRWEKSKINWSLLLVNINIQSVIGIGHYMIFNIG